MEDAGVYECYTDSLQGNVTLRFKYRDDDKPNRLRPSQLHKGHKGKNKNASLFEAILSAGSYSEMARELQKHRDTIQARWEMGHWTDCKQVTCGVAGYQAREVTCSVMVDGARRTGDPRLCTALASPRPPDTDPAHKAGMPDGHGRVKIGQRKFCSTAPCQRNGVAKQRRHVRCLKSNGEAVEEERCDKTQRPKTRKECENPSCKAEWHASDWGSCSSNCGTGGVQVSDFQTSARWKVHNEVCSSSGYYLACGQRVELQPAATAKGDVHQLLVLARLLVRFLLVVLLPFLYNKVSSHGYRPVIGTSSSTCMFQFSFTCVMQPTLDESCEDNSRYCDIIKVFHSCDSGEVRQKCCATCKYVEKRRR
ncbi:hypothetical protein OSTOST_10257 [Ostertagia ostertagi]